MSWGTVTFTRKDPDNPFNIVDFLKIKVMSNRIPSRMLGNDPFLALITFMLCRGFISLRIPLISYDTVAITGVGYNNSVL